MGPAIVSAVQSDATAAGSSVGIEEALASFVCANNDGSILASSATADTGVTDLKEIFEAAEDVLVTVESETTGSISALETVRDSLDSDIDEAVVDSFFTARWDEQSHPLNSLTSS